MIKNRINFLCYFYGAIICLIAVSCKPRKSEVFFQSFDHDSLRNHAGLTEADAYSQPRSAATGHEGEFSYSTAFSMAELKNKGYHKARVKCMVKRKRDDMDCRLVVSLEPVFNPIYYKETFLNYAAPIAGKWYEVKDVMVFPDSLPPETLLKIHLWSPNKNAACLDDLQIEFVKW
jgi:hypothetical protein